MLKVSVMKSSTSAKSAKIADYYKNEEKHLAIKSETLMSKAEAKALGIEANHVIKDYGDYVLAENPKDRSYSEWGGALAEKAGLLGKEVTAEKLAEVLEGNLLGQSIQRGSHQNKRCGHDLTFSAPKSISVMGLLYGDARLLKAHQDSVKEAMAEFARLVPVMRIQDPATKKPMRIKTDQIIYAMEMHRVSRNLDPQLHTHCLTMNMAIDDNGKLRAINIDDLYDQKLNMYLGKLYQASLNKRTRNLGYDTYAVGNGQFEITGIPKAFLESFSTRRLEIQNKIFELKASRVQTINEIAKFTRQPKKYVEQKYLHALWEDRKNDFDGTKFYQQSHQKAEAVKAQQAQETKQAEKTAASDISIDINNAEKPITKTKDDYVAMLDKGDAANASIDMTIGHIGRFQTKMSYHDVLTKALDEFAIDEGVSVGDLKQALEAKIKSGEITALDKDASVLTTEGQRQDELYLQSLLSQQFKNMKILLEPTSLKPANLKSENEQSIIKLFASTKQANMLNIKGASKSAITALIHGAVAAEKNIKVLTPNHYHVADIKANTNQPVRESDNLFSWIKNAFLFQADKNYVETLGGFAFKQAKENTLSNRDIIVVDQAEKLSVNDAQKLLEITQAGKAKLIYLNRDGAKDNKKTSGNITETLKLGGIESFDFSYQKTANAALNIQEIKDEQAQVQAVVNTYQSLSADAQDNTLVVAYTKKEVSTLNQAFRQAIKNANPDTPSLTLKMEKRIFMTPEQACVAKTYSLGERVDFFTKDSGVLSYKITGIDTKNNRVETQPLQASVVERLLGKSPKETSFNPLENKNPVTLIKTEDFEVIKGEKVMVLNTSVKALEKGKSYVVHDFDQKNLKLLDSNGEITAVSQNDFQKSSVQYDYARTLDYASENEHKNLIGAFKQYRLDKELTAELVTKAKDRIELFTDDLEKAKNRMKQSGVQPSVVTTIIKAHFNKTEPLTKYISDETKSLLAKDLTAALKALNIEANKSVLVKSVEHAINVLSDRQAAFAHSDLVEIAAKHCMAEYRESVSFKDAGNTTDDLMQKGQVLSSSNNLYWTTKEAIALERSILKSCADGKGVVTPLATVKATDAYLENHQANTPKNQRLTDGQMDAVKLISNTKDRFVAIQGYAGVGKSTMLQQAQDIAKHVKAIDRDKAIDMEFLGFASTHTAVKALDQKNIQSHTLQSLLFQYNKDKKENKATGDLSKKVFVLDEGSMVSNKDCHDFMQLVEKSGARAVIVGDIKQEESIGAGAPMKMLVLGDKIEVALMKDIKRQQEANYLAAVKAITKNKPDEAYQLLDGQQSHHEISYRGGQAPPPELRISVVESEVEKIDEDTPFARCFNDLIDGKVDENFPKLEAAQGLLRKLKIQGMRENMSEELGARTEDCRDKTITVLDAHTDREIVTEAVRKCDKANHLISPHAHENISISRLKNKNLTPHQMHDIEHYQKEMVLQKGADKYYEIMSVDKENTVLKLRDLKTNKLSHFAPLRANHHFNGLFEVKASGVALREQLIMTKTDKAKGIFAKDKMRVTAIDQAKGLVTLTNQEKQNQVILNKHDLSTLHWDYALNTTTFSAQGSDKPFAVLAHKSTSPLASIRSVYVGLTRGQRHVKVFTDDKAAFLKKIKTEFRDNTIAVNKITGEITLTEFFDRYRSEKQADRLNDINARQSSSDKGLPQDAQPAPDYDQYIPVDDHRIDLAGFDEYLASQGNLSSPKKDQNINSQKETSTASKAKETPPTIKQSNTKESNKYANTVFSKKVYEPRYLDAHGRFDIRKYGAEVAEELKKYTESVAQQLLGQPNQSRSDNKVMAYGRKNGSLKITLTGKWRGHYTDWSNDDRGDMLTLLMRETGMSYADAVAEGAKMVSMPEAFSIKETKEHEKLTQEDSDKQKKSYANAVKTWNKSHPINNTLAEKYLKNHRGIEDYQGADVRFHTGVFTREVREKYQPALVVKFKDKDGKLTGVESIYLERNTAKKMSHLKVPKRSYGTKKGSSVLINAGIKERNVTLIAEGVVTALSVKQAFEKDHILAVGGKENFPNIHPDSVKKHVILCADNDGIDLTKDRVIRKAINTLEKAGKHVEVVMPEPIKGLEKSDYNDTLKQGGVRAVFENIKPELDKLMRQENTINKEIVRPQITK